MAAFASQRLPSRTARVWFIGDSLTIGNMTYDAVMTSGLAQGGIQYQPASFQAWALLASDARWTVAGVFATASYTAAQILSTHVPAVISASTVGDTVVVLAGTNGNVLSDVQLIHSTLRAAGRYTVACTVPPSTAAGVSSVAALNLGIVRYAQAQGIPVCDFHSAVADTTTGAYTSAFNGDGVHPNEAGYRAMGYALSTALSSVFTALGAPRGGLVDHNTAVTGSLQTKPLALATPVSGTDYNNLASLGTSTIAAAADSDFVGGKAYVFTRNDTDISGRLANMTFVQGHTMLVGMALKATMTGAGTWGIRLESNTTGLKVPWGIGYPQTCAYAQTIGRFYSTFVVPSLPDYGYRLRVWVGGASSTVLSLGEVTILDLTAMGVT